MINEINALSSQLVQLESQMGPTRPPDLFQKADSDDSGGVDQVEFSDLAKRMAEFGGGTIDDQAFGNYDANGDGSLDRDELSQFLADNAPPPPRDGRATGPNSEAVQTRRQAFFDQLDSDGDGLLSDSEFSTLVEKISGMTGQSIDVSSVFSTYDGDGDGALSLEELDNFMTEQVLPNLRRTPPSLSADGSPQGASNTGQGPA